MVEHSKTNMITLSDTWRRERVKFDEPYFKEYLRHFSKSEPIEQWDDRIRLYSVKFNLAHIIDWRWDIDVREQYACHDS